MTLSREAIEATKNKKQKGQMLRIKNVINLVTKGINLTHVIRYLGNTRKVVGTLTTK